MSKFLLYGWAILLLTLVMSACSLVPNELTTAEKLIETAPDSALHILQHLAPANYKSDKSRALYGLLMIRTLDKKLLPLKPDSILDFSVAYYEAHPDNDRLAMCYLYKGRAYKYYFQYEKAMNYYLKALDEAKDSKDNLLLGRINTDIGKIFSLQSDFIQARNKYKIAYDYFMSSSVTSNACYSLINIGITYCDTKDFKTALSYFNKVYLISKDSMTKGAAIDEIGLCYYKSQQKDSALKYLRKAIDYPYLGYNKGIRCYFLARLYFDLKEYDLSYNYASLSFHYKPDIRTQRECYRILTNCDFIKGNTKQVTIYMNKYVALGDSIRKIDAQIKGSYMETLHTAKKEVNENKVQKWISWSAVLVVIVGFLFLLMNILRKVSKEKKEILEIHTEEKVGIHKRVIEDKRAVLQQQIENRKKQMQIEFKNAGSKEREMQLRNIYKELLHYDDPGLFYLEMDKLLNGLITKLRSRFSTLNENELLLCCYLLLHIPTYDMLILFEYNSDVGLKSLKGRLAKKLKLKNATVLEEFLLILLAEN